MTRIRVYVLSVTVSALAAALCVYLFVPSHNAAFITAALWMTAFSILAQVLVHQLPGGAAGSIGFIPFTATVLLCPNWVAVAAITFTNIVTETVSSRDGIKKLFNIAQCRCRHLSQS